MVGSSGSGVTTPFTVVTTPFTQNGETVAAGTYITNAFIQNGAITNAQIGDLQIDNAKVTSGLSAAKITTDQMNADRVKIDNLTLDTDGSGNLIIKNNGVVVNKLGSNSLGRVASVYEQDKLIHNKTLTSTTSNQLRLYIIFKQLISLVSQVIQHTWELTQWFCSTYYFW